MINGCSHPSLATSAPAEGAVMPNLPPMEHRLIHADGSETPLRGPLDRSQMPKTCHYAALWALDGSGAVSALCYNPPRPINLNRGQTWTLRPEATTCRRCRALLKALPPKEP